MGYHNALAGSDLHEPSRLRILNATTATLMPGNLVFLIGQPSIFGVITVTTLAPENAGVVGFVDSFINRGDEGTVVFIGKVNNVEIPASSSFENGSFLRVGADGSFALTTFRSNRVGIVLYRESSSATRMDIFINSSNTFFLPTGRSGAVHLSEAYAVLPSTPNTLVFAAGGDIFTNTVSAAYPLGFTKFGQNLTIADGNDSFTFTKASPADSTVIGEPVFSTVDITRSGLYEIQLDPYIYITGGSDSISFTQSTTLTEAVSYETFFQTRLRRTTSSGTTDLFNKTTADGMELTASQSRDRRGAMSWFAHDLFGYAQRESHLRTQAPANAVLNALATLTVNTGTIRTELNRVQINLTNGNGSISLYDFYFTPEAATRQGYANGFANAWNSNFNERLSEYTARVTGTTVTLRPRSLGSEFNITTLTASRTNLSDPTISTSVVSPAPNLNTGTAEVTAPPIITDSVNRIDGLDSLLTASDRPILVALDVGDSIFMDFSVIMFRQDHGDIYSSQSSVQVAFGKVDASADFSRRAIAGFSIKQVDYDQVAN